MTGWSAPIAPIWNARGVTLRREPPRSWKMRITVRLLATGETLRAKRILRRRRSAALDAAAVPGMEFAITSNEVFDLPCGAAQASS